jgi:hypothetical protein
VTHIDREEIERLPLNGRGMLTLLELAPGTNVTPATRGEAGQFTTTGQRPNTNYFTIDGVSANTGVAAGGLPAQATGGALPALSAFGSLDALISLDSVQEFRVTTSTSMAELGRMPGAIVALQSRWGTNDLHGSSAYRVRNELFSAKNWFANAAGYGPLPLRLHDFTQTFGGPLKRNQTFFFLSYERMGLRQPYVWRQPVPSPEVREYAAEWALPLLDLFPRPTSLPLAAGVGEWTGRSLRPAGLDAGGIRIDQALGSRLSLFARYNDAPSNNQFGTLSLNRLAARARAMTLGFNARPAARAVLDFRLNGSHAEADSAWSPMGAPPCALKPLTDFFLASGSSCDHLLRFSIGGVGQLISGNEGHRRQRQFQFVHSGSLRLGPHNLGFGADYRAISALRLDPAGTLGVIADNVADLDDKRDLWVANSPPRRGSTRVEELSLWLHDTWQASTRLTVTGGLRWEYSPAPMPNEQVYFLDPIRGTVFGERRLLWPTTYRNLAPRLGLAFRLTSDGRTVLRAGSGLYYDSSVSIATDILNGGPLSISSFTSGRAGLFNTQLTYGFMPRLRLPRVGQWNLSIDRAVSAQDVVTLGYLGAAARSLLRREVGGAGTTPTSYVALTTNHGYSNYHALQLQYRRRMARGLESSVAYAWSHSIDNGSSDAFLVWAAPGPSDKGSSDFDLRQSLTAAVTYEFSSRYAALAEWALDFILHARSGFPISVLNSEEYLGINLVNAFRPDFVFGQPNWVSDPRAAGGRSLNRAAFQATRAGVQGTLGRNAIGGFGMWQLDLALRREFRLCERGRLGLRIAAFNVFNHPNFGDPMKYLNSAVFGHSTSMLNLMLGTGSPGSGLSPILQTGGPRSLEGSLRFRF